VPFHSHQIGPEFEDDVEISSVEGEECEGEVEEDKDEELTHSNEYTSPLTRPSNRTTRAPATYPSTLVKPTPVLIPTPLTVLKLFFDLLWN
jgi:hypothetical protein